MCKSKEASLSHFHLKLNGQSSGIFHVESTKEIVRLRAKLVFEFLTPLFLLHVHFSDGIAMVA